jgi:NAD(P)-dependent dehydrogenase (short-subunit alcohol dehydrogenase family)
LGRSIAIAFAEAGTSTVAVARDAAALQELATDAAVMPEVADAADGTVTARLLAQYAPRTVVLVAGATPLMAPLQNQTWETFSINWQSDVQIAFNWIQQALIRPLAPGSRVIVISSGAALGGSPLSGGYAGAKATQRFIAAYAQDEANRAGLDLTFTVVFPRPSPVTDIGMAAVRAYSTRAGITEEAYVRTLGGALTPEFAAKAIVHLAQLDSEVLALGYLLTRDGVQEVG